MFERVDNGVFGVVLGGDGGGAFVCLACLGGGGGGGGGGTLLPFFNFGWALGAIFLTLLLDCAFFRASVDGLGSSNRTPFRRGGGGGGGGGGGTMVIVW
jgi:hypothetical protein